MNFNQLTEILHQTHKGLYQNSVKAVNINLTLRNWLFGHYIVEFEQNGEDRAQYGKQLLVNLANQLSIKGLTAPELSRCRQFYNAYRQILGVLTQESSKSKFSGLLPVFNDQSILGLPTQELILTKDTSYYANLIQSLSYTHFTELIKIEDDLKRKFYELLIIKTQPSVAELKRQIHTLSFERLGLSGNKELAFEQMQQKITPIGNKDLVKSHYFFEFLDISHPQLIEESELEQALINHLQEFIIELGNGFCFEARQKRILIDDEYFFIDLVFYHRILKCHVLIELKTEQAKHEHIGQLKVYLQHFKHKVMETTDNPPVGILLVTDKKKTMVEYAVADCDKEIFVSKYQFQLPDKKDLESFINREIKNL
jgi:predicted nuclease of restriction endonuclease-like (RecB) superfamily